MKKENKKGFTLIEVLTVIMIIAILASIVLVSLERARQRARDATIQTQLSQLRSLAETVYTFQDGYEGLEEMKDGTHSDADKYERIRSEILEMGGDDISTTLRFGDNNNHYCAYSSLVTDEDRIFCVDSLGIATEGISAEINCTDPNKGPNCESANGLGGDGDPCTSNADCSSGVCDGMTNTCVGN